MSSTYALDASSTNLMSGDLSEINVSARIKNASNIMQGVNAAYAWTDSSAGVLFHQPTIQSTGVTNFPLEKLPFFSPSMRITDIQVTQAPFPQISM